MTYLIEGCCLRLERIDQELQHKHCQAFLVSIPRWRRSREERTDQELKKLNRRTAQHGSAPIHGVRDSDCRLMQQGAEHTSRAAQAEGIAGGGLAVHRHLLWHVQLTERCRHRENKTGQEVKRSEGGEA